MQNVEKLTSEYETVILKITLQAVLLIKIPITAGGLFAFLRGDKQRDLPKEKEFFKQNLYSIFSNFSIKQLSLILNILIKSKLLEIKDGTLNVTQRGMEYIKSDEPEKINFLYRF